MKLRWGFFLVILALSTTAAGYVRSEDSQTGACLFWPSREVHWSLNEAGSDDVPLEALEAALLKSAAAWTDVGCSDMTLVYDGRTSRTDVGFDPSSADNISVVVWRETNCNAAVPSDDNCRKSEDPFACADAYGCWGHASAGIIALTTSNYNRNIGNVVDVDMEFNGSAMTGGAPFRFTATESAGPPCTSPGATGCVATDVQNTATHEFGHFLGLAHSPVYDATMFASAPTGETAKRSLAKDDESGLCAVYPAGLPPATCTPSGRITISPADDGCGCASGAGGAPAALMLFVLARICRRRENAWKQDISIERTPST